MTCRIWGQPSRGGDAGVVARQRGEGGAWAKERKGERSGEEERGQDRRGERTGQDRRGQERAGERTGQHMAGQKSNIIGKATLSDVPAKLRKGARAARQVLQHQVYFPFPTHLHHPQQVVVYKYLPGPKSPSQTPARGARASCCYPVLCSRLAPAICSSLAGMPAGARILPPTASHLPPPIIPTTSIPSTLNKPSTPNRHARKHTRWCADRPRSQL